MNELSKIESKTSSKKKAGKQILAKLIENVDKQKDSCILNAVENIPSIQTGEPTQQNDIERINEIKEREVQIIEMKGKIQEALCKAEDENLIKKKENNICFKEIDNKKHSIAIPDNNIKDKIIPIKKKKCCDCSCLFKCFGF